MSSSTEPELAWEPHRAVVKVPVIAQWVGKHGATIYRWLKGTRPEGLRDLVQDHNSAEKERRRHKVNPC